MSFHNLKIFFWLLTIVGSLLPLFIGCGSTPLTTQELKTLYGPFHEGETIKLRPTDLTLSPMFHKWGDKSSGKFYPDYAYLEKVECNSMAYLSDGLFVTGFLVNPKKQAGILASFTIGVAIVI